MPIVFYTQEEYETKMEVMYQKLFALARKLADAKGFQCIIEPKSMNGYCDKCPAKIECPFDLKQYEEYYNK